LNAVIFEILNFLKAFLYFLVLLLNFNNKIWNYTVIFSTFIEFSHSFFILIPWYFCAKFSVFLFFFKHFFYDGFVFNDILYFLIRKLPLTLRALNLFHIILKIYLYIVLADIMSTGKLVGTMGLCIKILVTSRANYIYSGFHFKFIEILLVIKYRG